MRAILSLFCLRDLVKWEMKLAICKTGNEESWNGMERNGMERNGMEWNGMEWCAWNGMK